MFSHIDHDNRNNLYCWYDYKGIPSRWVELKGRETIKYKGFDAHALKRCAGLGLFHEHPEIDKQARNGFVEGYWWTHLHSLSLGGHLYGKNFTNLSLMPHDIAARYHRFMQDWYYGNLLIPARFVAADGHKTFINVPILPIVVSKKDVPFLADLEQEKGMKRHERISVQGHDILVKMAQYQQQKTPLSIKRRLSIDNELAKCIYPPVSLLGKIVGSQTIAGGPSEPELIVTRMRRLCVPRKRNEKQQGD